MNDRPAFVRLVTFGDSWPYGNELSLGQHPYGEILAGYLGLPFENYSKNAASNEHMVLQLQKYVSDHVAVQDTLAIFFITSPVRTTLIDHDGSEIFIYPWSDRSRGDHAHAWFKYFQTPALDRLRTMMSVLSLQKICQSLQIQDYYIVGWSEIDFDFPGIDKQKIYPSTCAELFGASPEHEFTMARDNMFVKPNDCHPNQLGHQMIADTLQKWILNG